MGHTTQASITGSYLRHRTSGSTVTVWSLSPGPGDPQSYTLRDHYMTPLSQDFFFFFTLYQNLAAELPKKFLSLPATDKYLHVAKQHEINVYACCIIHMLESGGQGEVQGEDYKRESAMAEESHCGTMQYPKVTLCQAGGGSTCWVTSSHSQQRKLLRSCPSTNTAQKITTWHSLGLTAALELPQECTEFKSHDLSLSSPCPSRTSWGLERERSHSSSSLHPHTPHSPMHWGHLLKCTVHPGCLTGDHSLDNPTKVKPGEWTVWISHNSHNLAPEGRKRHNLCFFLCGGKTSKRSLLQHN